MSTARVIGRLPDAKRRQLVDQLGREYRDANVAVDVSYYRHAGAEVDTYLGRLVGRAYCPGSTTGYGLALLDHRYGLVVLNPPHLIRIRNAAPPDEADGRLEWELGGIIAGPAA